MKHALRLYQRDALRKLKRMGSGGFFVDLRMGKTLVMLRLFRSLKGPILVVAPGSAIASWIDDIEDEGTEYTLLIGSAAQRRKALGEGLVSCSFGCRRVFLINREGHRALPELCDVRWTCVVLDEAHFIKSPTTAVTKYYTKKFKHVPHKFCLTGTPNPESNLDFVCQFLFTHGHCCGFDNYYTFRSALTACWDGYSYKLTKRGRERMTQFVADNSFVLDRQGAGLDVPKTRIVRTLALPQKLRRAYDKLEQEFLLEYAGVSDSQLWRMSQYMCLRCLCSGLLSTAESVEQVWDGKVTEILELLRTELVGEQVVIWFSFREAIEMVLKALNAAGYSTGVLHGGIPLKRRFDQIRAFNAGEFQVILVQERVGESGIRLSAADVAIYYSEPPGLVTKQQSEDRILLLEKESLLIISLVVQDSVEHDIHRALKVKRIQSKTFLSKAMEDRRNV